MGNHSLVPANWQLPDSIKERLGRSAGPQRIILEEGHLLIVLHELPQPSQIHRNGVLFWRQPNGAWFASNGSGIAALGAHLATFHQELDKLTRDEMIADTARQYHLILTQLSPINRTVRHTKETLQKAREAMPDDERLIDYRDQAAALERSADLLLQEANYGLTFTAARRSEEEAEAARRLNVLAAIFLPLTALTGLFGMTMHSNTGFEKMPGSFFIVAAGGLALGLAIAFFLRKKS
jgi:hypothetical protein